MIFLTYNHIIPKNTDGADASTTKIEKGQWVAAIYDDKWYRGNVVNSSIHVYTIVVSVQDLGFSVTTHVHNALKYFLRFFNFLL